MKRGHGHEPAEEAGDDAAEVTEATSQWAFTHQAGHRPDVPGSRELVFVKGTMMGSELRLEAEVEETSPEFCLSGSREKDCALHASLISKWPCLSDCPPLLSGHSDFYACTPARQPIHSQLDPHLLRESTPVCPTPMSPVPPV